MPFNSVAWFDLWIKFALRIKVIKDNNLVNIYARTTILATGGVGQIFKSTTNPEVATGDGIAIAHRAGAELADLEFIQFHPTALKQSTSPLFLLSEALRGEGGLLIDKNGKRIMEGIHPQKELAPRDIVARAIFKYQAIGEVYIDMRHLRKNYVKTRFPNIYSELKKKGLDLANEPVPVTPAAHFICGGIKTDKMGRTSIKNLFAFGESAATGVHGANRLASNSLLEGIVFSSQIEKCLPDLSKSIKAVKINKKLNKITDDSTHKYRSEIKKIMWENVGIIRNGKRIREALSLLKSLKKKIALDYHYSVYNLETINMLETAILITTSALKRKKSLGTHYIEDIK